MNQLYELKDIVAFWQREMNNEFRVIQALVNLIEYQSENLPPNEKEKVILETLRKYGLYDVEFEGNRGSVNKSNALPSKIELDSDEENEKIFEAGYTAKFELYTIKVLNSKVEFIIFLN